MVTNRQWYIQGKCEARKKTAQKYGATRKLDKDSSFWSTIYSSFIFIYSASLEAFLWSDLINTKLLTI